MFGFGTAAVTAVGAAVGAAAPYVAGKLLLAKAVPVLMAATGKVVAGVAGADCGAVWAWAGRPRASSTANAAGMTVRRVGVRVGVMG